MTIKELKPIIKEIYDNYEEETKTNGEKYYVYDGEWKYSEQKARFNMDSSLSSLDMVAEIANDSINFLQDFINQFEDDTEWESDEVQDKLRDDLSENIDSLCIYTYDNEKLVHAYGIDAALLLVKDMGVEASNVAQMAYYIREDAMNSYITELMEQLSDNI